MFSVSKSSANGLNQFMWRHNTSIKPYFGYYGICPSSYLHGNFFFLSFDRKLILASAKLARSSGEGGCDSEVSTTSLQYLVACTQLELHSLIKTLWAGPSVGLSIRPKSHRFFCWDLKEEQVWVPLPNSHTPAQRPPARDWCCRA